MNRFFFTGYCKNERTIGIIDIEKIINKYGYIIDFKMFSDISLSIIIETEESNVDFLYSDLSKYMRMSDFANSNSISKKECTVLLNVSFSKGTGNLIIETPKVPG